MKRPRPVHREEGRTEEGNISEVIEIDQGTAGWLIGKGGVTIKKLQAETHTQIKVHL